MITDLSQENLSRIADAGYPIMAGKELKCIMTHRTSYM